MGQTGRVGKTVTGAALMLAAGFCMAAEQHPDFTGVWTNAATGEGYVDLTSLQTTLAAGKYFGELLLTNGEQRLPAIKFTITIVPNVVN